MPSPFWFILQAALTAAAFALSGPVARRPSIAWKPIAAACFTLLLAWPLLRFFAVHAVGLFGAQATAHLELTGLAIPAALLFGIMARHTPRPKDGRAIFALMAIAALYFLKAGWWMVGPGVPDLGPGKTDEKHPEVTRQTTDYTCVAASMVTLLRAHGIETTETEMARLANIEVGSGATDSRAILGLQRKLAGTNLTVHYEQLDLPGLIAAPKPALVQLDWGYFVSHMVPIVSATPDRITIADPALGLRTMPTAKFAKQWKGQAIVVRSGEMAK